MCNCDTVLRVCRDCGSCDGCLSAGLSVWM